MAVTRRTFLGGIPVAGLLCAADLGEAQFSTAVLPESFPAQDPAAVREMVVAAHGNISRVRELLSTRPALVNATWDWGFGDWESPIGAAAHMGNQDMAGLLLDAGARPTIFSAAMLNQLEVVKAFVDASPGIQRVRGPHGIPLLSHARAGRAQEVIQYLVSVRDAGIAYKDEPLEVDTANACAGVYSFGSSPDQALVVTAMRDGLSVRRGNNADRRLFHQGGRVFHPAGAPSALLRFADGAPATSLTVEDGPVRVTAQRR